MRIRTHPAVLAGALVAATAPIPADWISDRRALIDAATEGPWEAEPLEGNIVTPAHGTIIEVSRWTDADAELIADSRTSLPAALDALEAVLAPHVCNQASTGQRWCLHCGADWPCPSVATATAALGIEVQS